MVTMTVIKMNSDDDNNHDDDGHDDDDDERVLVYLKMYNGSRSLEGALDDVAAVGTVVFQGVLCAFVFYIL
jgi:hypothetical protein